MGKGVEYLPGSSRHVERKGLKELLSPAAYFTGEEIKMVKLLGR